MAHIKINKGLDIPIEGKPEGVPKVLIPAGEASTLSTPHQIALDLSPFDEVKFKLLVKLGEAVKLGQPLAEDKDFPGRFFVSPAGGVVREIRRGLKRKLLDIVIDVGSQEEIEQQPKIDPAIIERQELIEYMKKGGIFSSIRQRPFNFLANPNQIPRNIFVKGLESAPFMPPAEMQVMGFEKEFQAGLDALTKLTTGKVHLVYRLDTPCKAFSEAKNVEKHTAEGPHPISNQSLHIQTIDPIKTADTVIWTLDAHSVVRLGHLLLHGKYFVDRVVSIAGPGIVAEQTGYFKVRDGFPIAALHAGKVKKGFMRLVSGEPLTGRKVEAEDYLGYHDFVFCVIPENTRREFLHFFRLGLDKYTFSKAYLSGHFDPSNKDYNFTTNQHGEHRPFIDNTLYDQVMPLSISTMHLVKAVMAEDYELAERLGLLEVDSEDFVLPSFVDPSKIEMNYIIKDGLRRHAADVLK